VGRKTKVKNVDRWTGFEAGFIISNSYGF